MNIINIIVLLIFIITAVDVYAYTKSGTVYTTDGSYSDVSNSVTDASAGDTISIPSGEFTWSSQLVITKAITLKGAGIDKTTINHCYSDSLIYINPSSDLAIRVTGLYIKQTTNDVGYKSIYVNGSINGGYCLTKIRIDHNKIEKGTRAIATRGWVEGVIDSNEFLNCNIAIGPVGDNNYAWSRQIEAGTSHALFIEDNIFTVDNNTDRQPNEQIYHQEGARTVTRYNTYDASGYTNFTSCTAPFFDSHGNQNYYTGSSDFRGQPILEVYNNTIHVYKAIGCDLSHIRGGSALIYNNTYIYETGSAPNTIRATEEDGWQTLMFDPLRTEWAAEDQVTNTFIWNNTLQLGVTGTPSEITDIIVSSPTTDPTFIQKDRDYFMHAPAATGGKSTYPTRKGADDMTFSSSGPNAYYPYTPYTYPHPLRVQKFTGNVMIGGAGLFN